MKTPRHHAHPCNPTAIIYGSELEPGDKVTEGDVFCGTARLGVKVTEQERALSSGHWLPLEGWLARQLSTYYRDLPTSIIRPMREPLPAGACSVCLWINANRHEMANAQCAQHPTQCRP